MCFRLTLSALIISLPTRGGKTMGDVQAGDAVSSLGPGKLEATHRGCRKSVKKLPSKKQTRLLNSQRKIWRSFSRMMICWMRLTPLRILRPQTPITPAYTRTSLGSIASLGTRTFIHPLRDYQFNIVKKCLFKNTLVCLPTGLGKTFIAAVIMYNFYRWYPTTRRGKWSFWHPQNL